MNILSTISFSDSVDELDDKLDEDEDEEGDLDFSRLILLEHFTVSGLGLDEGEFIFFFIDLCRLSCFLVEEVSRFSDTLFANSSYELSSFIIFFFFFALPHHCS